jgi:hypothetical protein
VCDEDASPTNPWWRARVRAQKSFERPLHSHALIEVTRRFLKREYRDTYAMLHSGAGTVVDAVGTGSAEAPRVRGEIMN